MTTKRQFCAAVMGLLATALGGCGETDQDSTVSPTAQQSVSASISAVEITSDQGECTETLASSATISETDDGVAVSGEIVAPTPCHLATVTEQSLDDQTARFRIDVREDPAVGACVQCVAEVPFELTATLNGIDAAVVEIAGNKPETVRKDLS